MKPGYPMGSFYVYQWKGFDDKGTNLYQKADGSLTTSPTSEDLVVKGQASPKWTLGWNNTISWKTGLSTFLQCRYRIQPPEHQPLYDSIYDGQFTFRHPAGRLLQKLGSRKQQSGSNLPKPYQYRQQKLRQLGLLAGRCFFCQIEEHQHFIPYPETGCQICKHTIVRQRTGSLYNHALQGNGSRSLHELRRSGLWCLPYPRTLLSVLKSDFNH